MHYRYISLIKELILNHEILYTFSLLALLISSHLKMMATGPPEVLPNSRPGLLDTPDTVTSPQSLKNLDTIDAHCYVRFIKTELPFPWVLPWPCSSITAPWLERWRMALTKQISTCPLPTPNILFQAELGCVRLFCSTWVTSWAPKAMMQGCAWPQMLQLCSWYLKNYLL